MRLFQTDWMGLNVHLHKRTDENTWKYHLIYAPVFTSALTYKSYTGAKRVYTTLRTCLFLCSHLWIHLEYSSSTHVLHTKLSLRKMKCVFTEKSWSWFPCRWKQMINFFVPEILHVTRPWGSFQARYSSCKNLTKKTKNNENQWGICLYVFQCGCKSDLVSWGHLKNLVRQISQKMSKL